jgi:hypothetical protein
MTSFICKLRLDQQPCGPGQTALSLIKGEKCLGATFKGGRDMEEINGSLPMPGHVSFAQMIRPPANIAPRNRTMHQEAISQILLDLFKRPAAFPSRD